MQLMWEEGLLDQTLHELIVSQLFSCTFCILACLSYSSQTPQYTTTIKYSPAAAISSADAL